MLVFLHCEGENKRQNRVEWRKRRPAGRPTKMCHWWECGTQCFLFPRSPLVNECQISGKNQYSFRDQVGCVCWCICSTFCSVIGASAGPTFPVSHDSCYSKFQEKGSIILILRDHVVSVCWYTGSTVGTGIPPGMVPRAETLPRARSRSTTIPNGQSQSRIAIDSFRNVFV
jgi:hypothetical protein